MEYNPIEFPKLRGTNPLVAVDASVLETRSLTNNAFQIFAGDVINFDVINETGDIPVFDQKLDNSENSMTLIACTKNGKGFYLLLGDLIRRDADGNFISDFNKEIYNSCPTVGALRAMLKQHGGIRVTATKEAPFVRYGTTERTTKAYPVLTWK